MRYSPRQFVLWFLRGGLCLLVAILALQLWLDPFWVWRTTPPWLRWHAGHNWTLDIRMRSAKSLQVLTRDADVVLVGSSRTYRGFDPAMLGARVYNYGISGLRIREMEGFVRHLLRYRQPKHLIIGLDYFMFDARHPTVAGYNPAIMRPLYLADAIPAALFSADAIAGARDTISGKGVREGIWHRDGFKDSFPIGPEKMQAILDAQHENLGRVVLDDDGYASLVRTLRMAKAHGVDTRLYLSPMHPSQFALLERDGAMARFMGWKHRLRTIARQEALPFFDLSAARFGDEDALLRQGTTPHWLDPSHFTPRVGLWIFTTVEGK